MKTVTEMTLVTVGDAESGNFSPTRVHGKVSGFTVTKCHLSPKLSPERERSMKTLADILSIISKDLQDMDERIYEALGRDDDTGLLGSLLHAQTVIKCAIDRINETVDDLLTNDPEASLKIRLAMNQKRDAELERLVREGSFEEIEAFCEGWPKVQ